MTTSDKEQSSSKPNTYRAANYCFHCKLGPEDHIGPDMECRVLDCAPPGLTKDQKIDVLVRLEGIHERMHAGKAYGFEQTLLCDAIREIKAWRSSHETSAPLLTAAEAVLTHFAPTFPDSRAWDDCLVGLAVAVSNFKARRSEKASAPLPRCDCDPDTGCRTMDPAKFICCAEEMEAKSANGEASQ